NVWTRWKAISCWSRISASPPFAATTHVISGTTPWTISDILHVQRQPPSLTHSTGRDKEKAPQRKSLQSLIFTQSGRRDLNPRPPEPHGVDLSGESRQRVATTRCSGHRCCESDPEDRPGIVAESQRNSQHSDPLKGHQGSSFLSDPECGNSLTALATFRDGFSRRSRDS